MPGRKGGRHALGAGRPSELEHPQKVSSVLGGTLYASLVAYCTRMRLNKSKVLRIAIQEFLDRHDPAEK